MVDDSRADAKDEVAKEGILVLVRNLGRRRHDFGEGFENGRARGDDGVACAGRVPVALVL